MTNLFLKLKYLEGLKALRDLDEGQRTRIARLIRS